MQASSIGHRVADFLKQYPPFQFLDYEELLALAMRGRVKFHEGGELVYREGGARGDDVFVIQQGRVEILVGEGKDEDLRDLLGEGDLFGVEGLLGVEAHPHTARTSGDVILYALPGDAIASLARDHIEVRRYLESHFSLRGRDGATRSRLDRGLGPWVSALRVPDDGTPLLTCPPDLALREVARRMEASDCPVCVVVDPSGRALGAVRDADLRRVAAGELAPDAPAREIAHGIPTGAADASAGDKLLGMIRGRSDVLVLTADGTDDSPAVGVVREEDVMLVGGNGPLPVFAAIARATAAEDLAPLRERGEALLLEGLTGLSALDWCRAVAGELHAALIERIVALAESELAEEGAPVPDLAHCWLRFGSAGRDELLTRFDFDLGLVHADAAPGSEAEVSAGFARLGEHVARGVAACGFRPSDPAVRPPDPAWCRSLSGWGERLAGLADDPITGGAWRCLAAFDVAAGCGDATLAEALRGRLTDAIARNDNFVPLLANDSIAHLPPLTFFQGLVIGPEGAEHEVLDLWRSALQPLVDVARVFALEHGAVSETFTAARLADAAAQHPEAAAIFGEAGEAFRVALLHRARTGLAHGSDGARLLPDELSRYDQQLLKSAFRSILALLEWTAEHFELALRR